MKRFAALVVVFALCVAASAHAADKAPALVDSLGLLEKAVAKDSTKFDNLYRLGVMYLDREKMAEAAQVLAKANRIKPGNHKVQVNLGVALDAMGRPAEAQDYYKGALKAMPGDSVATCRMASSLYSQAKYQESMDLLRNLIVQKPKSHCAYFTMGVAFADAGLYRDAIRQWRRVVELAPDSPEAVSAKESIDVLERFINQK